MAISLTNRRWRDVAYYSLLAGLALWLAHPFISDFAFVLQLARDWYGSPGFVALIALAWFGVFWGSRHFGALPLTPRIKLFDYPPAWFAAIFVAGGWSAIDVYRRRYSCFQATVPPLALVITYIVLRVIAARRQTSPAKPSNPDAAQKAADLKSLDVWRSPEESVKCEAEDALGHVQIAERIAEALVTDHPCALVGPLGSGKSSIFNFVERRIRQKGFLTCKLSIWSVRADDVAARILETVIQEASVRYEVTSLRRVPSQYREILRSGAKNIAAAIDIFSHHSPQQLLSQFDEMLELGNDRLVVFIEDLDRNPDQSASDAVSALLKTLKPLKRITYALATDFRHGGVDFVRLFDHVEPLPILEEDVVVGALDELAALLWDQYPSDIHLDRPDAASKFFGRQSILSSYSPAHSILPPSSAMASLINTPRKLKALVRHVEGAWADLHGEVSLPELMAEVALRVAAPEAWQFLVTHRESLIRLTRNVPEARDTYAASDNKEKDAMRAMLSAQFDEIARGARWSKGAALGLLSFLCPTWIAAEHPYATPSAQSTTSSDGSRYSRRLIIHRVPEGVRDQEILAAIARLADRQEADSILDLAERDGPLIRIFPDSCAP